jgi:septal ring factor EnvC (AmiA/AmiB activator)
VTRSKLDVRQVTSARLVVALVGFAILPGCASPQSGQLSTCEQDKAQLLATIREQRDEVELLQAKTASLERRLGESETALARLDPQRKLQNPPAAIASQGKSSSSDLPWRPHRELASEKSDQPTRR